MNLRSVRRVFTLLSLLGALLALLPPPGWALCLSAGGHVAMEPACGDGPRDPGAPCEDDAEDCGPCVDFELAADSGVSPARSQHTLVQDSTPLPAVFRAGDFDFVPPAPRVLSSATPSGESTPILPRRLILIL